MQYAFPGQPKFHGMASMDTITRLGWLDILSFKASYFRKKEKRRYMLPFQHTENMKQQDSKFYPKTHANPMHEQFLQFCIY